MENDLEKLIFKIALENAIGFKGKTREKVVLGKLMGFLKEKKLPVSEYAKKVKEIVDEVNGLSIDKQKDLLESILETPINIKIAQKEKHSDWNHPLPPLEHAEEGKVVTRFPPEPNGYLHIGHAKAAIIDYSYAKIYNGKFILRFDDTNPTKETIEFYDVQKNDLKWLGIEWNEEYRTSDNLPKHYEYAVKLISDNNAYVCTCENELIRKNRFERIECLCRGNSVEKNLKLWEDMPNSDPQAMILRLKGDMASDNTAFRDPTLFRIIDVDQTPHPIHKNKYSVWPTYDMYAPIEDSTSGVTHPFRTKEYELRDEVYFTLLKYLGLRPPHLLSFSRLSMVGVPTSKRKINALINDGIVSGWDDPRLFTIGALKKRGLSPKAIQKFIYGIGFSKTESTFEISLLDSENKKVIENNSKRIYFVQSPQKIIIEDAPELEITVPNHPNNPSLGERKIKTNNMFYISQPDIESFKKGDIFRLIHLYNVELLDREADKYRGKYIGTELLKDSQKIQWVNQDYIPCEVVVPGILEEDDPSLHLVEGFVENSLKDEKIDEVVQFLRFGFVKLESVTNKEIKTIFTHISDTRKLNL